MEKILEKLEEYNIFNYLVPGVLFVYILKYYIGIDMFQNNILDMIFIYYFIGSLISRVGSVILEEILVKLKFITFSQYDDYIEANKEDKFIEKLLISNNFYRTIVALCISSIVLKVIKMVVDYYKISQNIFYTVLITIIGILYLFSYKKQIKYITKRVNNVIKN